MITTADTLPAEVQQTMDDVLLSVPTPNLIMKLGAIMKRLPSKGGRVLRMSRYNRLPTAPVPLGTSGATPPATPLTRVDIDAQMSFYGKQITATLYAVVKSLLIDLEAYTAIAAW
jgi:N4-gp56 family major capsid protein